MAPTTLPPAERPSAHDPSTPATCFAGDTEIIGIPAGSGGDGCEGGSDCMSW